MEKTFIETATGNWVNNITLPDDWTGAEGEWQVPTGHEFVDGSGNPGHVWNGTQFDSPNQITEEEQMEIDFDSLRAKRNSLLYACDWTQSNDSPLDDEAKAVWIIYRQELRDVPASTAKRLEKYDKPLVLYEDPDDPTWPDVP